MLLDLRLDVAPAILPVTLVEAKQHQNITDDSEDATLQAKLDGAVQWLDGYSGILGRALITQSWILSLDHFPGHLHTNGQLGHYPAHRRKRNAHRIHLPLPPLISVDQIAYVDALGADQVLATDQYVVLDGPLAGIDPAPNAVWPPTRRQARAVTISFTCGYGPAEGDVPGPIRNAITLLFGHLAENREATVGIDQRGTPGPLPIGIAEMLRGFIVR